MKLQDIPEDIEPRVGDILEIEQGDVCFEVRIIGITADGYLCEQDNVEGAILLEGVALDHDDVTDITGYITEERVRLDPKCWKGKKIGNPKTKMKGGVRVNNCVPEGQEDIEEAGPFSYGYKKPRKGSVAYWAEKKRKEQEKGKPPIEPKDQMVGVAKVTKGVAEGYTGRETKDGTWRVFKDGQAVAVAGPFKSRDEAHAWIKKHKEGVAEGERKLGPAPGQSTPNQAERAKSRDHQRTDAAKKARDASQRKGLKQDKDGTYYAKEGVAEGWGFDQWGHDTWTDAQKEVAQKKKNEKQRAQRQQNKDQQNKDQQKSREQGVAEGEGKTQKYEMMMRNGQVKKFVAKDDADAKRIAAGHGAKSVIRLRGGIPAGKVAEQGVSEAKSLKKRVRVVQGEHAGKTGWIREIKHGVHSTAPKRYYVDIDGGGQADNLPASALRLLKDQSDDQKGMAEGGHDDQFSLSGKMPATDRIPQDSTQHQDQQLAMVDKIKQQTIAYILKLRPEFERSDLELATTPELIQMLRDIQSGKMTEAEYQGRKVPLGKPMAGDVKKSKVYVRKPNGKVVKVNFGDKNMKIKKSNPKRRKSFRARHNCANPGPRWKARYWSCRAW